MKYRVGEFEEIGSTVKEFASEDATVVVGTAIDIDMGDAIRVTVVATGLGTPVARSETPHIKPVPPRTSAGEPNYKVLDRPAHERRKRVVNENPAVLPEQEDLLDIPAFLRRQAD